MRPYIICLMAASIDGIEDQSFGPVKLKFLKVRQFGNSMVELRYKV